MGSFRGIRLLYSGQVVWGIARAQCWVHVVTATGSVVAVRSGGEELWKERQSDFVIEGRVRSWTM